MHGSLQAGPWPTPQRRRQTLRAFQAQAGLAPLGLPTPRAPSTPAACWRISGCNIGTAAPSALSGETANAGPCCAAGRLRRSGLSVEPPRPRLHLPCTDTLVERHLTGQRAHRWRHLGGLGRGELPERCHAERRWHLSHGDHCAQRHSAEGDAAVGFRGHCQRIRPTDAGSKANIRSPLRRTRCCAPACMGFRWRTAMS